ncbi:MAG: hypothetical protein EON98_05135 [Chitinophagaceae bacterium]|nr:MAG: hypothetical protein EON98_05135 [Chitinophagaceae bacterium]
MKLVQPTVVNHTDFEQSEVLAVTDTGELISADETEAGNEDNVNGHSFENNLEGTSTDPVEEAETPNEEETESLEDEIAEEDFISDEIFANEDEIEVEEEISEEIAGEDLPDDIQDNSEEDEAADDDTEEQK